MLHACNIDLSTKYGKGSNFFSLKLIIFIFYTTKNIKVIWYFARNNKIISSFCILKSYLQCLSFSEFIHISEY